MLSKDANTEVAINHHGKGASSVYYTYRKFLDTSYENDLNVVLISGPQRFPHIVELSVPGNTQAFTCKEQVQGSIETLDNILTDSDRVKLNNVIGWFDATKKEDQYFIDMSDLMISKIEECSKTILYPCFSDSFTPERFKKHKLDKDIHFMHSLWVRQLEVMGIEVNNFSAQETDKLCGHLVPEFNLFFANMVFKKIKTGKWDNTGFFDVTIKEPRKIYYNNYKHE
jgi:hypothetical protein